MWGNLSVCCAGWKSSQKWRKVRHKAYQVIWRGRERGRQTSRVLLVSLSDSVSWAAPVPPHLLHGLYHLVQVPILESPHEVIHASPRQGYHDTTKRKKNWPLSGWVTDPRPRTSGATLSYLWLSYAGWFTAQNCLLHHSNSLCIEFSFKCLIIGVFWYLAWLI